MQAIKKGEIILVTSGEYSDFGIIALTEAQRDFSVEEALTAYPGPKNKPVYGKAEYFEERAFGDWLIKDGYLAKYKFRELYLGDYGMNSAVISMREGT